MDTLEKNKPVIRRFLEEVLNTGDIARLPELVAADCVETDGKIRVLSGVDGRADHIRSVRLIYADLTVTVEQQIAEGDWVATTTTARGTHVGVWLGLRPSAKVLVFTGVNVDRVVDGKIVELGGAASMLEPYLAARLLQPGEPETPDGA